MKERKAYIGGNLGQDAMDALDHLVFVSRFPDRLTYLRHLLAHLSREVSKHPDLGEADVTPKDFKLVKGKK